MSLIRFLFSIVVCTVAIVLPYRMRIHYFKLIANLIHLPFKIFGKLSQYILKQTRTENPFRDE